MKPNQQFINMIAMLYEQRQTTISRQDLTRHQNNETSFYAISRMVTRNGYIVTQTEPFSEQMIIELDKGCDNMYFISKQETTRFIRATPLEFTLLQGAGILYWQVRSTTGSVYTAVKLMSPDGCVQLKLITSDEITQMIYNVCELPAHFAPKF